MRKSFILSALMALVIAPAALASTECKMTFNLSGWSAFYKVSKGSGTITCDNGQKARITIEAKGGGVTFGKSRIDDGIGKFSPVSDISDLFGTYVQGEATAAAGKAAGSMAMSKGDVHLALTGKGSGFQLGVAFGKFVISKKK